MKPVTSFRVYPGRKRSGLYVEVRVFRTARYLREVVTRENREAGLRQSHRRTLGAMQTFTRIHVPTSGPRRTRPVFGRVNLLVGRLGVQVVTHEFMHATFAWSDRVGAWSELTGQAPGGERTMGTEERCCHAHSNMVRAFYDRAFALGLCETTTPGERSAEARP